MNPYQMKKEDVLKMLGTELKMVLRKIKQRKIRKSTAKTNLRRVKRKIRLYCFWSSTRIFLL